MSEHAGQLAAQVPPERLEEAAAAVQRLREVVLRAGQGQASVDEVRAHLVGYWSDHGDVMKSTAAAVLEQVRLQALEALYRWRNELDRQLGPASKPTEGENGFTRAEV